MLESPLPWIAATAVAAFVAMHARRKVKERSEDLARIAETLSAIADGRPSGSVLFSHPAPPLAGLTLSLDRINTELSALRNRPREEESRLEAILGSMQEGVIVTDAQRVLQTVNPAFLTMFRLTRDPRGQSVLQTLREAAFDELIRKVLATGATQSAEVELSGTKPRRFISMHANATRDASGAPAVVAVFRDTSRLRQLEDVRREFVANVSHELRTPLSIFHGYVEMLTDNPEMARPDQAEVFSVLRRNSRRLNAILEDLLTIARLESRHERLTCEPIDLAEFLHAILKDWEHTAKGKGLKVEHEIPAEMPPLRVNRLRLEQVMNNLFDNAVKYTEPGGRVGLRVRVIEAEAEIRVEDSGRGIPPADLPHIFERFYRADKARSREQGGTGLGLSIVKHIVQSHGGSVSAESTYAKGTTIIVRLPLAGPPEDVAAE